MPRTKRTAPLAAVEAKPGQPDLGQIANLTVAERALCARLISVHRERQYWMGAFIEWLLNSDFHSGSTGMPISDAVDTLTEVKKLMTWQNTLDEWRKHGSPLHRFYGERLFPDQFNKASAAAETDQIMDAGQEQQFTDLVRLWRVDHPEPEKPRKINIPAGHNYLMKDDD